MAKGFGFGFFPPSLLKSFNKIDLGIHTQVWKDNDKDPLRLMTTFKVISRSMREKSKNQFLATLQNLDLCHPLETLPFPSSLWMSPCLLSIIQKSMAISHLRTSLGVEILFSTFFTSFLISLLQRPSCSALSKQPSASSNDSLSLSFSLLLSFLLGCFLPIFNHKGLICYVFIF